MDMEKELLEELLKLTGCLYISDLRNGAVNNKIKKVVDGIKPHHYSVNEWRDVYSYITSASTDKETEEEIRILLKHLE